MKELSALDIHYLVKELQILISGKIDQIYHSQDVLIRVHSSKTGKKILRINKNYIFLSEFKEAQPTNPTGFCMTLRKYIGNCRIRKIEQVKSERILKLELEKEDKFILYAEIFGRGNIILTDKDNLIITSLIREKAKRIIEKGSIYEIPLHDIDFKSLDERSLHETLQSFKGTIVKCLATEVGLGGFYAELVLKMAQVDKKTPSKEVCEAKLILEKINDIMNRKIQPSKQQNKIIPFDIENSTKLDVDSLNQALAKSVLKDLKQEIDEKKLSPYNKKKERLLKIIEMQDKNVKKYEKESKENQRKGELMYEKYQEIKKILDDFNRARETMSFKEIKEKLKDNPLVKQVDEKNGIIVIDSNKL